MGKEQRGREDFKSHMLENVTAHHTSEEEDHERDERRRRKCQENNRLGELEGEGKEGGDIPTLGKRRDSLTGVNWLNGTSTCGPMHSCKTRKAQTKLWQWWDRRWSHLAHWTLKFAKHIFREPRWRTRGQTEEMTGGRKAG